MPTLSDPARCKVMKCTTCVDALLQGPNSIDSNETPLSPMNVVKCPWNIFPARKLTWKTSLLLHTVQYGTATFLNETPRYR